VKEYIRLGADPKVKTEKGHSLIHLACIQGSMPVIAYLKYEVGIDLNQRDQSGVNCLHLAAKAGNEFVVLSLIAWGCDCDTVDSNNNSPLHYAALNGNYKVVRALLQAGAKRGTNNSDGETALQIAFKNGNLDLLPILVSFT
jgi:ankyrin repeat protein